MGRRGETGDRRPLRGQVATPRPAGAGLPSGRFLVALATTLTLIAGCSAETPSNAPKVSREPVSVRGWIDDVDTGPHDGVFRTVETEKARRAQAFQATNMWVEGAPYVSGAVAENGAFILLDVPPGKTAISFAAPGVNQADLILEDVPANADVLIPGLIIRPGGIAIADPKAVQIRLAASISSPRPTKLKAKVAGITVPVMEVPIRDLIDRRDYPPTPAEAAQVPVVK